LHWGGGTPSILGVDGLAAIHARLARAFDLSLRHHFVDSTLRFIPGENHINEVVLMARDDDPMAREMLKFMDGVAR